MSDQLFGAWPAEQEILKRHFKGICIEIGCYKGWTSRVLAPVCDELICIDPWDGQQDGSNYVAYNAFREAMKGFSNVRVIRDRSQDADLEGYRGKVTAVFIDGLHTYDGCLADIRKFEGLLHDGGYVFVHDVFDTGWMGVRAAVWDHLKETGKASHFYSYHPTKEETELYGHGVSGLAWWQK